MNSELNRGDLTLLGQWRLGNQDAAGEFHRRYAEKLLCLIRANMARRFSARLDPDDVAQSVLRTFFGAAADGRLNMEPGDDVWKLLQSIALNKVRNQVKFHDAQKRSVSRTTADQEAVASAAEPTEQDAVEVADLIESMIRSLDPHIARTMELLLAGQSQDEIATQLNVTTRTIRRYRDQIAEKLAALTEA